MTLNGYMDITATPPPADITVPQDEPPIDLDLAQDFRTAIGTDQLMLHYQPIISLATRKIEGLEALMRWNCPSRGKISPSVFIPLAEKTGLIVAASRWALRESCRALNRIESRTGIRRIYMSVNFSCEDFAEESFLDQIYTILSETDVLPTKIRLEISEDLLTREPETARRTLSMCRKAGLGITMDDLQTMEHLDTYLKTYPIDMIKIDKSYIAGMTSHESAMDAVRHITQSAAAAGIGVTAEGIEDEYQLSRLREIGCGSGQGYYFFRPQSESETTDWLRLCRP